MDPNQLPQTAEEVPPMTDPTNGSPAVETSKSTTSTNTQKREYSAHPPPINTSVPQPPQHKPTEQRPTHAATKRHHVQAEHATSFTSYPLGIALFMAWLVALFASFSFDVVVDVFQRYLTLRDPPALPWLLLVCGNTGIHLFLLFVVVLLGRLTKRRFYFFQPFVGGDAFVILQIAGYGAVYVTATARAVMLSQRQERYGAYTVLGAFAVVGHCLLLWSLSFFQSPISTASRPSTSLSHNITRGWRTRLANSLQREVAWIVLCSGIVVLSSTIAEYYPSYRFMNVLVIISFVLASLLAIQYVFAPQWLPHRFYHVFLPVALQSPSMYVLQLFGNGLLVMTSYAELVLFNAQQDAPPSWHLSCGLMAVMAIGAHLLLVHQLHAWVVEEEVAARRRAESTLLASAREAMEQNESTAAAAPSAPSEHKPHSARSPSHHFSRVREEYRGGIGSYGPVLPSLFSVVLCVVLISIIYVSSTSGDRLSAYVRQGLSQTEALLVAFLFVQPIVTHLMGVFLYGKDYRIWQPFEGNPEFILLQGVGWFCYGLAIFFSTLQLNEHSHDNFLLFLMAFLVLSQFFIHMSVVRFGRSGRRTTMKTEAASTSVAGELNKKREDDEGMQLNNGASSSSPARSDALREKTSSPPSVEDGSRGTPESFPSLVDAVMDGESEAPRSPDGARQLPSLFPNSKAVGADTEHNHGGSSLPFSSRAFNSDPLRSSSLLLSSVLNGELLLSMVLISVSLVLRVVVIAAAYIQHLNANKADTRLNERKTPLKPSARTSAVQLPVAPVVVAAIFFSVLATPVVQLSMRRRVQLLKPLSYAYVTLATLGWGTYLLLLSRFLVLWGLLGMEKMALTSPIMRVGLSYFVPSSVSSLLRQSCDAATADAQGHHTTGEALSLTAAFEGAVEGFVWCFPFLCLLAGNLFQTHAFLREAATKERVRRAVASVLKLFRDHTAVMGAQSGTAAANSASHPSHNPEAHLAHLLRTITGSHDETVSCLAGVDNVFMASESGLNSSGNSTDPADLNAIHDAASYMTFTLCAATAAAFLSAAFLAYAQPIMTLGFGAVGTVMLGMSCMALHYIYGTRVHNGTRPLNKSDFPLRVPVYTFFMPFAGGAKFVALQSVGWISFTSVSGLMIACMLEGKGTAVIFVVMAGLSVVAQLALWRSVGCFDSSKVLERGFVQRNAEGFLAAISVVATVSFCRLYDMAEQGRATAHVVSSMVPVVACSIAVCLAVPLGLLSLQRQAELYGLGSFAAWFANDEEDDEDDKDDAVAVENKGNEDCTELEASTENAGEDNALRSSSSSAFLLHSRGPSTRGGGGDSTTESPISDGSVFSLGLPHSIYSRSATEAPFSPLLGTPGMVRRRTWSTITKRSCGTRRSSLAAVIFYLLSTVLAMLVIVLLPFAVAFMGYAYYTQRATVTYGLALRTVEALLCCFTALVVLPMIVVPVLGRSSTLRNVHSAFCCWALYNIPTYTFLGGISTPFIYNCRGTHLFTINMCFMALLSNLPYIPVAMSIFSVCSFVYFLKYHFYDGLYIHKHELEPVQCVVDLAIAVFWLCYQRRYHGRPEITGRLQSRRATRFFQQYFFRGLVYYFSMRVIVGEGFVLPQEEPYVSDRSEVPRVDLSNPQNQYMFSFHPHGVFPGTSIVVPKTEIWEKAVGRSKECFVSTHCADIVFNVPLMREFPMCLGAMSVSRRGIESSLKQGNSPLIVTGGQSEMLLTRMTDYEMHVVCHHIGFIRIAIKNRVPLVPIISFSESNILDNVHCIRIQRWFLNRIAFPFPTIPIGRWYLPLPTTKPVTIVVGQPISPLPGHDNPEDPAHVEELRLRYFEHLEVLFYKYRAEAGYPEMELFVHNGIYNAGVRGTPSVATSLIKSGGTQKRVKANLSVEMLDSAVRRAVSTPPEEKGGEAATTTPTTHPTGVASRAEKTLTASKMQKA